MKKIYLNKRKVQEIVSKIIIKNKKNNFLVLLSKLRDKKIEYSIKINYWFIKNKLINCIKN